MDVRIPLPGSTPRVHAASVPPISHPPRPPPAASPAAQPASTPTTVTLDLTALRGLLAAWDGQSTATDARPPATSVPATFAHPLAASEHAMRTAGFVHLLSAALTRPRRASPTAASDPASLSVHLPCGDSHHCTLHLRLVGARLVLHIDTDLPVLAAALAATRRAIAVKCAACGLSLAGFAVTGHDDGMNVPRTPHRLDRYGRQCAAPGSPAPTSPLSNPASPGPLLAAAALLVDHVRAIHDGLASATCAGAEQV